MTAVPGLLSRPTPSEPGRIEALKPTKRALAGLRLFLPDPLKGGESQAG
jgi:hypothetical protein